MKAKRIVLCTAEFSTEEEAIAFGETLKRFDLTYAICENRLTVDYTGDDWLLVVKLFEALPKRSIIASFDDMEGEDEQLSASPEALQAQEDGGRREPWGGGSQA